MVGSRIVFTTKNPPTKKAPPLIKETTKIAAVLGLVEPITSLEDDLEDGLGDDTGRGLLLVGRGSLTIAWIFRIPIEPDSVGNLFLENLRVIEV